MLTKACGGAKSGCFIEKWLIRRLSRVTAVNPDRGHNQAGVARRHLGHVGGPMPQLGDQQKAASDELPFAVTSA